MAEATLDIVRAVYAAWNREELPGPQQLFDPSIEYVNPPDAMEPGVRRGIEAFAKAGAKTLEGWESWKMELWSSDTAPADARAESRSRDASPRYGRFAMKKSSATRGSTARRTRCRRCAAK